MHKKIKIAEVITRLDRGGAPEIVETIFKSLNPVAFECKLITGYTAYPSIGTKELLKNAKVIYIPQLRREINLIRDLSALLKLYKIFLVEKFNIVHTHTAKAGVLGRIAAYMAGIPCIIHQPHGHNFYGYFGPIRSKMVVMLESFLAGFTDKIIALTELEKKDFMHFKICGAGKIAVINNGLDLGRYRHEVFDKVKIRKEFDITAEELVVGFIGRLEPVKGVDSLIKAARIVLEKVPGIKFIITGDGTLKNDLELQVKEAGLAQKIAFTGWREDVGGILSIMDLCVLPSLNEALGIVLLQAQAQGVPVVATAVGGIAEVVINGKTGILVPPKDTFRLAEAMISLLQNKEKRLKMSETARHWAAGDRFSMKTMLEKVNGVYNELIEQKIMV